MKKESTVEQGTRFELEVADILKSYGYDVQHNVTLKGTSGAGHQIDVLAKHKGPLHHDKFVVECKAYAHNVEKDILMKQVNICEDLKFGGVMVFTTADFASGCYKTAAVHGNVTLFNGDDVARLSKAVDKTAPTRPSYIKPAMSESAAKKHAKSRAKKMGGSFFHRRPKVSITTVRLVCYPYHTIKYHIEKTERRGFFRKSEFLHKIPHEVSVDGRLGVIMSVGKGLSYGLAFIKDMSADEITLLRCANKKGRITKREIVLAGLTKETAAKCMPRMHGLGLVTRMSMQGEPVYKVERTIPTKITSLPQSYSKKMVVDAPGILVDSLVPTGQAINSIQWLSEKIDGVSTTYYPFYDIRYEDVNGTRYNEMFDALTGKVVNVLRETMADWMPPIARDAEGEGPGDGESEGGEGVGESVKDETEHGHDTTESEENGDTEQDENGDGDSNTDPDDDDPDTNADGTNEANEGDDGIDKSDGDPSTEFSKEAERDKNAPKWEKPVNPVPDNEQVSPKVL